MKIRIGKLFLEILPAFIFFLIMFHILAVTKMLTLRQYGIAPHGSFMAVIGALVIAKVILLTDKIPFLNLYPRKPLIWNVVLKTIVFSIATLFFIFAEELVREAHKHGSFVVGYRHIGSDMVWPAFWVSEMWINTLLFMYCIARECMNVIGVEKMRSILFGAGKRPKGAE